MCLSERFWVMALDFTACHPGAEWECYWKRKKKKNYWAVHWIRQAQLYNFSSITHQAFSSLHTVRSDLTDSQTNGEALHPSGFHPHKSGVADAGEVRAPYNSDFSSFSFMNTNSKILCHHPALQVPETFSTIRRVSEHLFLFTFSLLKFWPLSSKSFLQEL